MIDPAALPGNTYTWVLGELDVKGEERFFGPYTVAVEEGSAEEKRGAAPVAAGRVVKEPTAVRRGPAKKQPAILGSSAAETAVAVGVVEDGIYEIGAGQIGSLLGLPVQEVRNLIARGNLSLENLGRPVAYDVSWQNDGMLFYGEKADSLYTDENVYWISRGEGLSMASYNGGSPAPAPGGVFTSARHEEVDYWANTALHQDPGVDFWTWDYIVAGNASLGTKNFVLKAPGAATATGSATLQVNLLGAYDVKGVNPDHYVRVAVNGTVVGETAWDGVAPASFSVLLDQALLVDGDNTVTLTSVRAPGASFSIEYLDSLDLAYLRNYGAVGGTLLLSGDGNEVVSIGGFTEKRIRILDISDPLAPVQVTGLTRDLGPDGLSRFSFRPSSPDAVYLASAAVKSPASVRAFVPSGLNQPGNAANYLVIAPASLAAPAAELVSYRASKGFSAKLVDLQSVYDEFNHGLAEPAAIKALLAYAHASWSTPPRYVTLAGKGTIDYKNLRGIGDNLVPTLLAGTPEGLFAADNRFADLDGDDGVPEMAIGRLPVVTDVELTALVAKIAAYEGAYGPWHQQVIMAADKTDPRVGNFALDSAGVAALIPADYAVTAINLVTGSIGVDRPRLLGGLNAGAYLFNYIGHGGMSSIASDGLLKTTDMASLGNAPRLPLTSLMTCVGARFEEPGWSSLGESLLLDADGGSIAVWSTTGFSQNDQAVLLDEGLFRAVFGGEAATYGDAVRESLVNFRANGGSHGYMLDIYNLLGDPALDLR
jgi:hypothetical protein